MFEWESTPWKCRHGNSDKEQLLLYMCARSPLQTISMYVSWQVISWIPVLLISHRCLSTVLVQYLCFCKLNWLICTMVVVDFRYILFFTSTEKSWWYRAQLLGTIYTKNTLIILSFFLLVKIKGTFCMFNLMIFDNNPV